MSTNEILVWGIVGLTLMVLLLMGPGMWSSHSDAILEKPLRWLRERRGKSGQQKKS
ncbi:MAG: hypothetical protein WBV82_15090 [Myxococcaceae bacterium]